MNKLASFARAGAAAAAALLLIAGVVHGTQPLALTSEAKLLEILRTGQPAEKAVACKQLSLVGTAECVPELAKLLADPQLNSWSRIALEAIPDGAADAALVEALGQVEGLQLVGVVNSIGVRRSPAAVSPLAELLKANNADVAAAAALALGRIGDDAAAQRLRQALQAIGDREVKAVVAEGCILCAERLATAGRTAEAAEIYDEVRQTDVTPQKTREATRGAILARGSAGVPLLLEQLNSNDQASVNMALMTARQLPGPNVAEALASELKSGGPARAVLILAALAERNDGAPAPAVLDQARSGDPRVRIAALQVIARHGDAACLPALLEIALDDDASVADAARTALARLRGEEIDRQVVSRLDGAGGKTLAVLLQLVGERRIEAADQLKQALASDDVAVRAAALWSLGETARLEDVGVLIDHVTQAQDERAQAAAAKALQAAAVRMADRDAIAAKLAAAVAKAPAGTQPRLLETLGAIGGAKALEAVAAVVRGSDPQLQDVGSRVLGQWMTADAAPVLLELSRDPAASRYQVRLLRGYLRIARQFVLPVAERAEMCRQALAAAQRPQEQQLVLEVLQRYPATETLAVAAEATHVPGLKDAAQRAALAMIAQLASEGGNVSKLLADIDAQPVALQIVKAQYGAGGVQKDVTAALARHVGPLPMIVLPAGYNESFGGDPAPSVPKLLRIEYRLNGQAGEATFAENAAIVFPMPE